MTILNPEEQSEAYTEAVRSGLYNKQSGLTGKYDNVRRLWEDEITRIWLRPHLFRLIERSQSLMRRVRILDLGCGSADGYELLMGVRRRDADLKQAEVDVLSGELLGEYTGVDLNDDLLKQARGIYGDHPKMTFQQADFSQGLPLIDHDAPFDLYFTSYGTFSHHNDDATAVRLLADIAEKVEDYCIVVCDWIGRWSYEWRELWTNEPAERQNMDYVVSYIYDAEERQRQRDDLQHLNLRLMSRPEAETIIAEASKVSGVDIRPLQFFDRSVFTGRHMDTGDYNRHAQPLRAAVNSLHEANQRTELGVLIIDYVPREGFEFLNDYYERLAMAWNTLVRCTAQLLETYDPLKQTFTEEIPAIPASYPAALRDMMERMRCIVKGVGWLDHGLPRENIIEPQLGYALRYLVSNMQDGRGCAHGLVGILEIDKRG